MEPSPVIQPIQSLISEILLLTSIESLLFSQQRLNRRKIPSVLLALHVSLLIGNPTLHHISLPHEL